MRRLSSLYVTLQLQLRSAQSRLFAALLATRLGQGLVEYSLLLGLVIVVVVGIVTILGQTVSGVWYDRAAQAIEDIFN
ncbi:MAG TPA: hypothetical protein VNL77_04195 [Roseiflexaceae bacterium]|nr:hypothetical protein [Roseiflexaceae bacterium]